MKVMIGIKDLEVEMLNYIDPDAWATQTYEEELVDPETLSYIVNKELRMQWIKDAAEKLKNG
jgi:hypothetical protein